MLKKIGGLLLFFLLLIIFGKFYLMQLCIFRLKMNFSKKSKMSEFNLMCTGFSGFPISKMFEFFTLNSYYVRDLEFLIWSAYK